MLQNVQGSTALNLDAKGRLAIPARHRDSAGDGRVVITAHPHGCLVIYSVPEWEPIRDQILRAPSLDSRSASLKRLFIGYAQEETLDSVGRVLIAPSQRQFAKLEKKVWLIGQVTHFELWSDAGWEQQLKAMEKLARPEEEGGGVPPGFENLVL
ncbi:MAG: division/cell wall cluster transcriptional repressor MraZ [Azoarcus sp.]|jgi:MraZ protein|nr:division/cell wall cluster transcriptional repressor MraZ [Azoarcus sp.]